MIDLSRRKNQRDPELDAMYARAEAMFQRKQELYRQYDNARKRCDEAFHAKKSAEKERSAKNEILEREYNAMQSAYAEHDAIWEDYGHIRDSNNSRIESLNREADYLCEQMRDAFERASSAYSYGDHDNASAYSAQGHDYKNQLQSLNNEIGALCREVSEAKQNAKWRAPKVDSSAYHQAKATYNEAKRRHEESKITFKTLEQERDLLKAKFDEMHAEHARLNAECKRRLEEVKAEKRERRREEKREREKILDDADIRHSEREDAKIAKRADGTTHVYHGGIGKGDGLGHGHVALDRDGKKTYDRDAFEEHGRQNYVDEGRGITFYNRNARSGHEPMGIAGGINLRGKDWYSGKHPGVIGHSTQYYEDGVRISRSTRDGILEEDVHWTDERLPDGHPDKRKKPKD